MLLVAILLALILYALWQVHSAITNLSNRSSQPDLSEVEDKLDSIYKLLGGNKKEEEKENKERKELRPKLIRLFMSVQKKTKKEAEDEADRLFEDAEFEETHDDYPTKFSSMIDWVKEQEIEEHNQKKYGHLVHKAKDYIKGKDTPLIRVLMI